MFTNAITFHLSGNAATRRGLWCVRTFRDSFCAIGHFGGVYWSMECDFDSDTATIVSPEPYAARLMAYFVNHIRDNILHSLGDYRVNILTTVIKTSQTALRECHRIGIRIDYGPRKTFHLVVMAPLVAQHLIGNFSYLFEQMETTTNWDVNSISHIANIPDGVQFVSREEDVTGLVTELEGCIQEQLPDMLDTINGEPLMGVSTVFVRRGPHLYIHVGLERLEDVLWGPTPPTMPLDESRTESISPPNDSCAICRQALEYNIVRTQCKHVYHKDCMHTLWQSCAPFKCPLCRFDITELCQVKICAPTVHQPVRRSRRLQNKKKRKRKP